jgi:hypothetical protein
MLCLISAQGLSGVCGLPGRRGLVQVYEHLDKGVQDRVSPRRLAERPGRRPA